MARVRGFFEYRILAEKREDYLQLLPRLRAKQVAAGLADYSATEAVARKNQFLETFLVPSLEEYHHIEANLMKDPEMCDCYRQLNSLIEGGPSTKKIWFFTELAF